MEVKSEEIPASLHNNLDNKLMEARAVLMICLLISPLSPNKNNDNLYVFTFLGAR